MDSFSRLAKIPHAFNHGENRDILVFCKTEELREQAEKAGATLVGDVDVVKKVEVCFVNYIFYLTLLIRSCKLHYES